MTAVTMGARDLEVGSGELGELVDSTPLLGDGSAMHDRLQDDGYLLLRGVIDRETVLLARAAVCAHARSEGWLTADAEPTMAEGASGKFLGGLAITRSPAVLDVLEAPSLVAVFADLLGEPVLTFSYKWMRLVGRKEFTGAHIDHVYMSRGSSRLLTAWVPLDDVPFERGPLAICVGSHRLPGFQRLHATYGEVDVDRDLIDGVFTRDPLEVTETFGGQWCTAELEAGDILVFTMRTMHASLNNTSDRARISCDVRFQPASEPADERWVGENPLGHYGLHSGKRFLSIAEARARWDL